MLGFVLSATIIGTQKPTRQTQCALTVAIGVRRLCPAAAASISSIVGGCSTIGTQYRSQYRSSVLGGSWREEAHCVTGTRRESFARNLSDHLGDHGRCQRGKPDGADPTHRS
jgi:hypothetical protein